MNKHFKLKSSLSYLLFGTLFLFSILACSSDDDEIVPDPDPGVDKPELKVNAEDPHKVSNEQSEHSVAVLSNIAWEATTDASWITITNGKGEAGTGSLKYTVAENTDEERTGKIVVTGEEGTKVEFSVVQESGVVVVIKDMYVTEDGKGSGSSWSDPTSLESALDEIESGNTIFIAAGTYTPTKTITNGNSDDVSDNTFEIDKYITVKGGFPKNPSEGATSDPKSNKTILSGNLGSGVETYHVVTVTAPRVDGQKVVIDGVTITRGNGFNRGSRVSINDIDFSRGNGAGMNIGNAIVEVLNTDIVDNKTSGSGNTAGYCAGVFIHSASEVTFKNCKINDNLSSGNGGGLWVDRSVAYVYDSEINRNSGGTAAGVHGYPDAKIYVYNSTISENQGTAYGAGFYVRENSKGVLVNCLVEGNVTTTKNGGAGLMMYANSELDVISTTVVDNVIENGPGGGIYRRSGTNVLNIYNSIIAGNISKDDGPEVDMYEADGDAPVVKNTVITDKAYDANGAEISGETFDRSMINASYVPTGSSNPAITKGMTVAELTTLKGSFTPPLEDLITSDLKGNSRSNLTTMGALVK